jgi:hypothetical protein
MSTGAGDAANGRARLTRFPSVLAWRLGIGGLAQSAPGFS